MLLNAELTAPCHFGTEAVLKREIRDNGWTVTGVEDGRVSFTDGAHADGTYEAMTHADGTYEAMTHADGTYEAMTHADGKHPDMAHGKDSRGTDGKSGNSLAVAMDSSLIAEANIRLRSAERILLTVGRFEARTFDELFEGTKKIPWEEYLPKNAKFWVAKASSVRSALFSPPDIQSIMKKAMVERMKAHYGLEWFPEDGPAFPLRVSIRSDVVTVGIDTTGAALHKRGYRVSPVIAPISETLAASIIALTPWSPGRILTDPFCGSGTIPIEAAMRAKHIAPGLRRKYLSENWTTVISGKEWRCARERAESEILTGSLDGIAIQGYDIDDKAVRSAMENARAAGVSELIHFQRRDVRNLSSPKKYGFLITNPPYGERLEDRAGLPALYREIGRAYERLDSWSMFLITAWPEAEKYIGRKADKNRKIYNGMLKTYLYGYMGPKPPRKSSETEEAR